MRDQHTHAFLKIHGRVDWCRDCGRAQTKKLYIPSGIAVTCRTAQHRLVDLARICLNSQTDLVIRWCRDCGGIVSDADYDGRTQPGAYLAMQFPLSTEPPTSTVRVELQNEEVLSGCPAQGRIYDGDTLVATFTAAITRKKGADGGMYPAIEFSEK